MKKKTMSSDMQNKLTIENQINSNNKHNKKQTWIQQLIC